MFKLRQQTDIFIAWSDRDEKSNGKLTKHEHFIPQAVITDLDSWIQSMTEQEEKFATFFKQSYDKGIDSAQMSYEQLDSWIDELEDIILTAKASVQGATLAKRERKAKLSKDDKEKTSDHDSTINVSDSMSSVNKRKDRMTKIDKLKDMYDKMVEKGTMSREDADSMLGLVKIDESKQSTTSFNAEKKEQIDTAKLAQELLDKAAKYKIKQDEPVAAIDFDALFGPKKEE